MLAGTHSSLQSMWDLHRVVCQRGLLALKGGELWDPTLIEEGNETFFIRVWKPLLAACFKNLAGKPDRESLKRTISASGGLESLQEGRVGLERMVLDLSTYCWWVVSLNALGVVWFYFLLVYGQPMIKHVIYYVYKDQCRVWISVSAILKTCSI